mmetsp:Transcript_13313/g.21825  ORF Transcript_13313/g.21825 Transcript_13313/m.21825 type:complete len:222 (+) Transcript_13313:57-722(+)
MASKERVLLQRVLSAPRNPDAVLKAIDEFCWKDQWMMNVGEKKGEILDREVSKAVAVSSLPKLFLEFGAYCGYSAVRIGRLLGKADTLLSIEIDSEHVDIARQTVEHAGLKDKVKIIHGSVTQTLPSLRQTQNLPSDLFASLIFFDHWKDVYLPDLKVLESTDLLKAEVSVVVADNVIFPGAPEFLAYIRSCKMWSCVHYPATLEYRTDVKDGVEVCRFLG